MPTKSETVHVVAAQCLQLLVMDFEPLRDLTPRCQMWCATQRRRQLLGRAVHRTAPGKELSRRTTSFRISQEPIAPFAGGKFSYDTVDSIDRFVRSSMALLKVRAYRRIPQIHVRSYVDATKTHFGHHGIGAASRKVPKRASDEVGLNWPIGLHQRGIASLVALPRRCLR